MRPDLAIEMEQCSSVELNTVPGDLMATDLMATGLMAMGLIAMDLLVMDLMAMDLLIMDTSSSAVAPAWRLAFALDPKYCDAQQEPASLLPFMTKLKPLAGTPVQSANIKGMR